MARRKRDKGGGGDNSPNWMDTYGDMVTLLLCFFVMLLSTSNPDQEKWEILVKSLNPSSEKISQIVDAMAENPGEYEVEGGVDKPEDTTETLYYALKKYVQEQNLNGLVSITKGDTYDFITFDSTVFFQPNDYRIQESGKQVLDGVANILAPVSEEVDEIRILGHTSQASAEKAYDLHNDRFLASNRADSVLLYLQDKDIIAPEKLVSVGYGQYRPIAGFDTAEGRSKNRRVEMFISTKQSDKDSAVDEYYDTREAKGQESEAQNVEAPAEEAPASE